MYSKKRLSNGFSDFVQENKSLLFSELSKIQSPSNTINFEPISAIIQTLGKNIRPISNFLIGKLNITEKIIENPNDTEWIWPRCYGRQVRSFLQESDEIENIAINLNLKRCPVRGVGTIQKTMRQLGEMIPIHRDRMIALGDVLSMDNFSQRSNEQIRRNIENGFNTIISRVTDRHIDYMDEFILQPLENFPNSQVDFFYPHPDMGNYISKRETEKVKSHTDKLHLDIPIKPNQSSLPEIAEIRRIRLFAGTLTALYHLQKEFPLINIHLKKEIAPTARCTLGFNNNDEFTNSFFIQMAEWDIGLDSIGREIPLSDEIKPELKTEVENGTESVNSNDKILDLIYRLIYLEEEVCNNEIFSNNVAPIIKLKFENVLNSSRPNDESRVKWLQDIIAQISIQQKIIDNELTPQLQSKFEKNV